MFIPGGKHIVQLTINVIADLLDKAIGLINGMKSLSQSGRGGEAQPSTLFTKCWS
jgi:hypothetical protein